MNGFALTAVLVAMLAWGIGPIFDKLAFNSMPCMSPYAAVLVRMIFSLICIAVIALVSGAHNDIRQMEARTVVYLAFSGLLAGVLAQVAYYFAVDAGQISKIVLFTAAYPLVTLIAAAVALREPITWQKLVAGTLIVAGLVVLAMQKSAN